MSTAASAGTGSYQVSAPPVATPTAKSQEMVLVRRSELYSLKRSITSAFDDPMSSAEQWAFTWLGVGLAGGLALMALLAPKGNKVESWAVSVMACTTFLGLFLAGFMGWSARKIRRGRTTRQQTVCNEIDELDERAPTTVRDVSD